MNNVLIYFCANVQILIRPGTIVFTKSDLTPGEKRRISPRFDRAPDVSPVFLQDSTTHPARGPIFLQDSTAHPTRAPYFSKIRPRTRREVQYFSKIRPHTRREPRIFPRFDRAPGARSRISPRFDRALDAGGIFGKYSIHVYPVAPRSQSVHSLPILQPHGRDTLLPFLHTNGLLRFSGQI